MRDVAYYVESKDFELGLPLTNFHRYHELWCMKSDLEEDHDDDDEQEAEEEEEYSYELYSDEEDENLEDEDEKDQATDGTEDGLEEIVSW